MKYRNLGRTGVKVSPLCLGTMNFGGPTPEDESIRMIHHALERGINFLDTANVYNQGESERVLAKALADGRRQKTILATKFYFPQSDDPNDRGASRRHIIQAVEDSLKRLDTEWIDLYQIHRPVFTIPQEETIRALDDLVTQGKVRYIGTSTYPAWMIMEALALSERHHFVKFSTEQPPYNLLDRRIENELVPLALRYDIGLLPWSPLAMGVLAGRYRSAAEFPEGSRAASGPDFVVERISPASIKKAKEIAQVATDAELTPSQLALLWVKDQPGVTAPIIGPRTMPHLDDALAIIERGLDPGIEARLNDIIPPGSAVADFFNTSGWMHQKLFVEE